MKWFGIITKSKQIAKTRKQKEIGKAERRETLPGAHLSAHLAQFQRPSPPNRHRLPPRARRTRGVWPPHAGTRRATSCLPLSFLDALDASPERHAPPCLSPSLSRALILSPGPLSLATEHAHRRRSPLPRPPPFRRCPELLPSSCTSSPTPSPSHVTGRAPKRRPDAFPLLGRRRSASPPRSAPTFPEPASTPTGTAVSS